MTEISKRDKSKQVDPSNPSAVAQHTCNKWNSGDSQFCEPSNIRTVRVKRDSVTNSIVVFSFQFCYFTVLYLMSYMPNCNFLEVEKNLWNWQKPWRKDECLSFFFLPVRQFLQFYEADWWIAQSVFVRHMIWCESLALSMLSGRATEGYIKPPTVLCHWLSSSYFQNYACIMLKVGQVCL